MGCDDQFRDPKAESESRDILRRGTKATDGLRKMKASKFTVGELLDIVEFFHPTYSRHETTPVDVEGIEKILKQARKR